MPHPLAYALAARLGVTASTERLLLLGIGDGRNVAALLENGNCVDVVDDDPGRAREALAAFGTETRMRIARASYAGPYPFAGGFTGALSTHALLHGDRAHIAASIAAVRNRLLPGAPFFTTLGSTRDPRYGTGTQLGMATFAPLDGNEAGVPHTYFTQDDVRALFAGFALEPIEENATASAGRWAHRDRDAERIVHWFVRATRAQ